MAAGERIEGAGGLFVGSNAFRAPGLGAESYGGTTFWVKPSNPSPTRAFTRQRAMTATARHLLRLLACLAGMVAALAVVLIAALGSGAFALAFALHAGLGSVARRANGRVAVTRPRSTARPEIAG